MRELSTFVAYCCARVGFLHDDDYDDRCSNTEKPASGTNQ